MYKLSGVTKNYQKGRGTVAALRGVDLVVEDGEWLAIQGPTGHGKSTLLQILGGLDRPSAGLVDFDGRDLAQLREAEVTRVRAQSMGFIFQTFNLIPTLSAQENVETALVPLHVSAGARRQRAASHINAIESGPPETARTIAGAPLQSANRAFAYCAEIGEFSSSGMVPPADVKTCLRTRAVGKRP